jgi:hypothetical protein
MYLGWKEFPSFCSANISRISTERKISLTLADAAAAAAQIRYVARKALARDEANVQG